MYPVDVQNQQSFSSKETCKLVSITYRQLDYWARENIFVPTVEAKGSGSSREYSFTGLSLSQADLVMTSDSVFLNDPSNPKLLIDIIKGGQGVFTIVALSQAADEVRKKINNNTSGADASVESNFAIA